MYFKLLALYGGPDQVMTVTSAFASILGVLLIFWHKVVAAFMKVVNLFRRRAPGPQAADSARQNTTKIS
jgi:hypothetical protein